MATYPFASVRIRFIGDMLPSDGVVYAWPAVIPFVGDSVVADGSDPDWPCGSYWIVERCGWHVGVRGLREMVVRMSRKPPDEHVASRV